MPISRARTIGTGVGKSDGGVPKRTGFCDTQSALYDRGYALLKAIVAHCADWPGPAKALADAAILRCDITTRFCVRGDEDQP